jgi:hypothetical protein
MHYREALPSSGLSNLILSFWEFAVSETVRGPVCHYVFSRRLHPVVLLRNVHAVNASSKGYRTHHQVSNGTGMVRSSVVGRPAEACAAINPELDRALLCALEDSNCFADKCLQVISNMVLSFPGWLPGFEV